MKTTMVRCLILLLGLALNGWAVAEEPPHAEEARKLFTWWDGLGYPDVTKLPMVRVFYGGWRLDEVGAKHAVPTHAFLLEDAPPSFRVFTTDLRVLSFKTSAPGTPAHERVGKEPTDLLELARTGLATMRSVAGPIEWHDEKRLDPFELHRWGIPNQAWRLLVLARACAGRGEEALALELVSLALREGSGYDSSATLASLRRDLAEEAHRVLLARLPEDVTFAVLRDDAQRLVRGLAESERPAELVEDTALLERMAKQEASPPAPGAPGPARDSVEDLMQRLRTIRGTRFSSYQGTLEYEDRTVPSVHELLARHGAVAVPALIVALDDRSFTRSTVEWSTGKGQRREFLEGYRVGDAALEVLDQIAAGAFRPRDGSLPFGQGASSEEHAELRRAIDAWWKDVQARGEVVVLAERVARADAGSVSPAERLVSVAPDAARTHLIAAVRKATHLHVAGQLARVLGEVPGEATTETLLALLREDPRTRVKLAVAGPLLARGRREGLLRMLEEWSNPTPPVRAPESPADLDLPADPGFRRDLFAFLLEARDIDVLTMLRRDLQSLGTHTRFEIVAHHLRADDEAAPKAPGADTPAKPDAAYLRALEDLLGACLGDVGEAGGVWMQIDDIDVDVHVGRAAAWALSVQFPASYRYDPRATPRERERQRAVIETAWRQKRGLPPLPPPKERLRPEAVPKETLVAALDRLAAAQGEDETEAAFAAAVRLGLGALPGAQERLAALSDADPRREPLTRLVARLASIITSVQIEPKELATSGWQEQAEALQGTPFTGTVFVALVLHATRDRGQTVDGIHLGVERYDDGTGTEVAIRLFPATPDAGAPTGWEQAGPSLWVGARRPGGRSGGMAYDYPLKESAWTDEAEEVDAAFLAAPQHGVRLGFSIAVGRGR